MSGHGHVTPNPDGSRARCGGPGMCKVCSLESAALKAREHAAVTPTVSKPESVALTEADVRRIVAEMINSHAHSRIEWLRRALRDISNQDDNAFTIGDAIELAASALLADDKLARGES
jgi:hypothetical protein